MKSLVKDKINVAIDGPVASGKTTIGKKLAQQLNYQFLDSGLLFRHFAQFCQKNNPSELTDEQVIKLSKIWQKKLINNPWKFSQQLEKARGILSASAIGNLASQLSPLPELRKIILDFQRALTQEKTWVVVGRDITSEVLPHAEVKIFLTADLETRVERRYQQDCEKKVSRNKIKEELLQRDVRDQNRSVSPLRKTADSHEINVTNLTPDEAVKTILILVNEKLRKM